MSTDDRNFADNPRTIGEIRSDKTEDCADWKPRDALIDVLRRIDSGLDVESLIVCWRQNNSDGKQTGHFRTATPDSFVSMGLLSHTMYKLQE